MYAAWSVIAGEQPTTAKWNILGSNDLSFNNGTGIANLEIGTVTALKIDWKCSGYLGNNWTNSSATFQRVPIDTLEYDTSGNMDISVNKGRITMPAPGFMKPDFGLNVTVGASSQHYICTLYKNGTEFKRGIDDTVNVTGSVGFECGPPALQLNTSDYIEPYFFSSSSNTISAGQSLVFFGAHMVSNT